MWYAAKILAASLPLKVAVTRFFVWANPANTIVPTVGRRCSFVLIHILKDASYFYCFTTINFAKLSWRALQSMILSVTNTAPQHTRFILPPIHPTKSIAMLNGRYFSFTGNVPWKFHEPSERDTGFSVNAAAQTGAGTSFGANGDPHTWAAQPLLIFTP